ncbi:DNA kinase/phosphatase Pnk1, partial [Dimargaris xerosporica]
MPPKRQPTSPAGAVERKRTHVAPTDDLSSLTLHDLTQPIVPTTQQRTLLGFVAKPAPASAAEKPAPVVDWLRAGSLIIGQYRNPPSSNKIACFDLDATLIKVKGNHVFPKSVDDWLLWIDTLPQTLCKLVDDGYKIVIMSNQGGLKNSFDKGNAKAFTKCRMFLEKLEQVAPALGVPLQILAATRNDLYRKPRLGMWHFMERYLNDGLPIDLSQCYYVGDAAGRAHGWKSGLRKDHASTDRKFAENIGIPFYTPEEYFCGEAPAPFSYGTFDPRLIPEQDDTDMEALRPDLSGQEVVVIVGYPASGKSSLAKMQFAKAGYVYVNQDTLKTRTKCVKVCGEALRDGKSVVIDNTNPDRATRKLYIQEAQKVKCPVRCIHYNVGEDVARHNNFYRAYGRLDYHDFIVQNARTSEASAPRTVPDVAYYTYASRFEEPTTDEG